MDETLEAVALILRDLKTEFHERLAQVSTDKSVEEGKILTELAEISTSLAADSERITVQRQDFEISAQETSQRIEAVSHRLQKDAAARKDLKDAVAVLQQKYTLQEEDLKQKTDAAAEALENVEKTILELSGQMEDARARHQTVLAQLAEIDKKAIPQQELDDLRTEIVSLDAHRSLSEYVKQIAANVTTLGGRFDELRDLNNEISILVERMDHQRDALVKIDARLDDGMARISQDLAKKKDVEALQDLLEETAHSTNESITATQEALLRTQETVQEHDEQRQRALEALRDTFADRQQQLRDKITALRTGIFDDLGQELREFLAERAKDSDRMLVGQAEQIIGKLAENIKGERGPPGQVSRVQVWVADYEFRELALVHHCSGLWQAVRDTMEEPGGDTSDWQLIASGIETMTLTVDELAPGSYRLATWDSAGRQHETAFRVPLPTFHKTWEPDRRYKYYDSVMEDGHRWLAVTDEPSGPPSRSDDWVLFGMRGGRGARGAKGDPGPIGPAPAMDEVLDAYNERLFEAKGTPVSSFRGSWRYGSDYMPGDMVRGDGAVALCREAHRAETPPTTTGAQWEILFELPEIGPRPQELQAQITALTAQVQTLTGRDT